MGSGSPEDRDNPIDDPELRRRIERVFMRQAMFHAARDHLNNCFICCVRREPTCRKGRALFYSWFAQLPARTIPPD